ncbi:MAG TPA: DUF2065 domain-containing protein [Sedimenticola sp.]|nr:DUF2065 domain-containing protein [Sedimenticola sp.]
MWQELLVALSLVLVIEGFLPFLSPGTMRRMMQTMAETDDRALRIGGLLSMVLGVVLLYFVH